MTDHDADLGRLEAQFLGLETTMAGLEGVTMAFRRELDGAGGALKATGREAAGMSRTVSGAIRQAFDGMVFDGKRLGDALRGIGQSVSGSVLNQALAPVHGALGSGVQALVSGLMPFAKGGVVSSGRVQAFARGGVVDGPVRFPMRGGTGLMGEAGPEAILPLARGADGRLGVRAGGGGGGGAAPVRVTMNIATPDVEGFRRSRSQVAAELGRALQIGGRNL